MNPNLFGVLAVIVAIALFEIRTLLEPERRQTLIWFCVVHGFASTLAVLQTAGVELPNPSRIIERLTMGALRLFGIV